MVTPGYLAFHPNPKKPDITLPEGACDSHCHVFGPADRFPYSPTSSYFPVDAPKETLFERHRFLGFSRSVLVQASCHGSDNSAMIDALQTAGDSYRGVAIVKPDIPMSELEEMHEAGVRAVRFNFVKRLKAAQSPEDRRVIIDKVGKLGWHIVVYFEPEDLPGIEDFLREIPLPVVIDHMGCVPVEKGTDSEEFRRFTDLIGGDDKFWVKVSCPERLSKAGPPYSDVDDCARALVALKPDRVLWGTDWPHPNMKTHAPDDGLLTDRLGIICPDRAGLQRLLVDNPTALYWT